MNIALRCIVQMRTAIDQSIWWDEENIYFFF